MKKILYVVLTLVVLGGIAFVLANTGVLKGEFDFNIGDLVGGFRGATQELETPELSETNLGSLDSDSDNLTADEEEALGTDPEDSDSDDDGLPDGLEVNMFSTEPLIADTDGGGVEDGDEIHADPQTDPLDASDDVSAEEYATVEIAVVDASGNFISDLTEVNFTISSGESFIQSLTAVASTSVYQLEIPVGVSYDITVTKDGYVDDLASGVEASTSATNSYSVTLLHSYYVGVGDATTGAGITTATVTAGYGADSMVDCELVSDAGIYGCLVTPLGDDTVAAVYNVEASGYETKSGEFSETRLANNDETASVTVSLTSSEGGAAAETGLVEIEVLNEEGNFISGLTESAFAFDTSGIVQNFTEGTAAYELELTTGTYNLTVTEEGYVSDGVSALEAAADITNSYSVTLDYGQIITVYDESGTLLAGATVTAGLSIATMEDCTELTALETGIYGCTVPTSETAEVKYRVELSGYDDALGSITNRTANSDITITTDVTMTLSTDEEELACTGLDILPDEYVLGADETLADVDLTVDVTATGEELLSSANFLRNLMAYLAFITEQEGVWYGTVYLETDNSSGSFTNDVNGETGASVAMSIGGTSWTIAATYTGGAVGDTITAYVEGEEDVCTDTLLLEQEEAEAEALPDLTVTDISLTEGSVYFDAENSGEGSVEDDVPVAYEVYVDGGLEADGTVTNASDTSTFLDAGVSETIEAGELFEDPWTYEVEVCLDIYEAVEEADETNNCYSEDITLTEEGKEALPDLTVTDIAWDPDSGIVTFDAENIGEGDVESDLEVTIEVNLDDVLAVEDTITEGEAVDFEVGVLFEDPGTYEVEVCVDTDEAVTEEDETNNCRSEEYTIEEEEEEVAEEEEEEEEEADTDTILSDSSYTCTHSFTDIEGLELEDLICRMFKGGIVSGYRNQGTIFGPNNEITRAEWIKVLVLLADIDTGTTEGFVDVNPKDWFYDYVVSAQAIDMIRTREGAYFNPNIPITRADAVLYAVRLAAYIDSSQGTLFGWTEDDIPFIDIDKDDYFTYAVIIANQKIVDVHGTDTPVIEGYESSAGDVFRPFDYMLRSEAMALGLRAYLAWFR